MRFCTPFILALSLSSLLLLSLAACEKKPTPAQPQTQLQSKSHSPAVTEDGAIQSGPQNAIVFNYRVTGMHCGGCANVLKAKLAKVKGVIDCDASFDNNSATITATDPEASEAAMQVIAAQGFTAALLNEDGEPVTQPEDNDSGAEPAHPGEE